MTEITGNSIEEKYQNALAVIFQMEGESKFWANRIHSVEQERDYLKMLLDRHHDVIKVIDRVVGLSGNGRD